MAASRMNDNVHQHIPVLLKEATEGLILSPDGIYVDATFGRGSHSRAILNRLSPQGRLIAFDKDLEAVAHAKKYFSHDPRFSIFHTSFSRLHMVLDAEKVFGKVDGILFDLGVSSPQLDQAERGFSFSLPGTLDMRMDQSQGLSAMEWLSEVDEKQLADTLWQYGEEKASRRIARAIVTAREQKPIATTTELAEIISRVSPRQFNKDGSSKHPATRSFQAIRIVINKELEDLSQALSQALNALAVSGRLCVISFHSLEDRVVKQFIREQEKGPALPPGLPIKTNSFQSKLKAIGKPIKPSLIETNANPRARSAILRIAEKLS